MNRSDPSPPARRASPLAGGDWLVLAAVAALGLVNVLQPFTWDQAMFTLGARRLHEGGVLYRDFWEIKQPGIYAFYDLAGSLFGFGEAGVHLLELLWQLALCVVLLVGLRDWFDHRWAARAASMLTVGLYYAVAGDWHLTQVESLAGLPMLLALAWGVRAADPGRAPFRLLALSGVAGGCALLFKMVFLPVVAALWLVALVTIALRADGGRMTRTAATALLAGLAIPLGLAAAYFAAHRALGLALELSFAYPARLASRVHELRLGPLATGLAWFTHRWAPAIGLGLFGAWGSLRRRPDPLALGLVLWLATGFGVILLQRASFWEYHYMLFVVPLGLLASRGLDLLWPGVRRMAPAAGSREIGIAATLATLALFSGAIGELTLKTGVLVGDRLGLSESDRIRYQRRMSRGGAYAAYSAETAFLTAPGARPGPIVVIGDPLSYWLARRDPAITRGAWFPEYLTAEEWSGIAREVRAAHPAYLFVDHEHAAILEACRPRSDAFLAEIAADFRLHHRGRLGTWYEPAPPGAPTR